MEFERVVQVPMQGSGYIKRIPFFPDLSEYVMDGVLGILLVAKTGIGAFIKIFPIGCIQFTERIHVAVF